MASGDVVGFIHSMAFPGSNPATPDIRVGGSTPAESFPVYDFAPSPGPDEMIDFVGVLWGYDGGGLTVRIKWGASSATSNNVVWQGAFRAIPDDTIAITGSHTYDYNFVQAAAPSGLSELSYDNITFTDGADMDSLADGEQFIFRLRRDADDTAATDDMTGDAEFVSVLITET